jgi:glycosyltransferase involved in cell wall biosynthesis
MRVDIWHMRILLIPEFSAFGGTRTYFRSLLELYHSKNYEVYILLKNKQIDQETRILVANYGFIIIRGVDFSYVYKLFGKKLGLILDNILRAFYLILIKFYARPLLVVYSQGNIYKVILQLIINRRYMFIVHSYPTNQLNAVFSFMLNKTLGPERIILTVSKYSRDCIRKYWTTTQESRKYIYYIYNYVDLPCRKSYIKSNRNTILTLGHVVDYKNPFLWVEVANAVSRMRKVKFIWAGDGPLLEACRQKVGENDLIKFIGFIDDVEVLYRRSILYFQPSLLESHGISVLTAMSHGIPCVVSNIGGLPESIRDGYTGYVVNVTSFEEAVEKIILLLDNDDLRIKFSENAIKVVSKKFSKELWERKMLFLHNRINNLCQNHKERKSSIKRTN